MINLHNFFVFKIFSDQDKILKLNSNITLKTGIKVKLLKDEYLDISLISEEQLKVFVKEATFVEIDNTKEIVINISNDVENFLIKKETLITTLFIWITTK